MTSRKPALPYQPLLLRLLHGATGISVVLALVSAYWTYDTYDGRWGRIPLPTYPAIEGIHGTFGLWSLLVFPVFLVYAVHRGQRRLVQPDWLQQLPQVGKPIWWYTLNRLTNTIALLALAFALFSGKMMGSDWLPQGELNHGWYYAHLVSWGIMVAAIALHLLINAKVGGAPLLLSMVARTIREKDHPRHWPAHVSHWWAGVKQGDWRRWFQPMTALVALEVALLLTIVAAWILPLFKA